MTWPSPWSNQIISQLIVAGTGPGTGLFIYSGVPALGNPPIFYASGSTADPYGNAITPTVGLSGIGQFNAGNTIINVEGTFTYSGTPAFGNLVTSSTGSAGTDLFGNAYLLGLTTYSNIGGVFYAEALQGQQLAWLNATSAAGPYTALSSINTTLVGINSQPTIRLSANDIVFGVGTNDCFWDDVAGSLGLNAGCGPFIPNESFHSFAGGTNLSGTFRVKLLPWNAVWLDISASWNGAIAGGTVNIGSLPSASYYPTNTRQFPLAITGTVANAGNWPRVFVPTSGALQIIIPAINAVPVVLSNSIMYATN